MQTIRARRWTREDGRRLSRALFLLAALPVSAAIAQVEKRTEVCVACHGADGNSQVPGIPSIAGQPRIFLENQLFLFREGVRTAPQKEPAVAGLSDREIKILAGVFAASPVQAAQTGADPALFNKGRQIAQKLGCGTCHLPDYQGREQMPRLAGQREDFLAAVMLAYQRNSRPGGDTIMAASLYGIAQGDIKAMAHYLSRLK